MDTNDIIKKNKKYEDYEKNLKNIDQLQIEYKELIKLKSKIYTEYKNKVLKNAVFKNILENLLLQNDDETIWFKKINKNLYLKICNSINQTNQTCEYLIKSVKKNSKDFFSDVDLSVKCFFTNNEDELKLLSYSDFYDVINKNAKTTSVFDIPVIYALSSSASFYQISKINWKNIILDLFGLLNN